MTVANATSRLGKNMQVLDYAGVGDVLGGAGERLSLVGSSGLAAGSGPGQEEDHDYYPSDTERYEYDRTNASTQQFNGHYGGTTATTSGEPPRAFFAAGRGKGTHKTDPVGAVRTRTCFDANIGIGGSSEPRVVTVDAIARTQEIQILWVLVFFSVVVCVGEMIVASRTHSVALRSDGLTLLSDVFSYLANLLSEYLKLRTQDAGKRSLYDFCGAGVSLALLFVVTVEIAQQSVERMQFARKEAALEASDKDRHNPLWRHHHSFLGARGWRTRLVHNHWGSGGNGLGPEGTITTAATAGLKEKAEAIDFRPVFICTVVTMCTDAVQVLFIRHFLRKRPPSANANVDAALLHFWSDVLRGLTIALMSGVMAVFGDGIAPATAHMIDGLVSLFVCAVLAFMLAFLLLKFWRERKALK
eukprot:g10496.t1